MHPGYEFLYVLEGELELRHGDQESTLEPGDAVYFDSGTPHSYQCAGKAATKVIIVTMHQPPAAIPMRPRAHSATTRTDAGCVAPGRRRRKTDQQFLNGHCCSGTYSVRAVILGWQQLVAHKRDVL